MVAKVTLSELAGSRVDRRYTKVFTTDVYRAFSLRAPCHDSLRIGFHEPMNENCCRIVRDGLLDDC